MSYLCYMARVRKLSKDIKIKIGYPCVSVQVKRTYKVAMYLRDDGVYEVFRIKHSPPKVFPNGERYPWREHYPSASEFDHNYAVCIRGRDEAEEAFVRLGHLRDINIKTGK